MNDGKLFELELTEILIGSFCIRDWSLCNLKNYKLLDAIVWDFDIVEMS